MVRGCKLAGAVNKDTIIRHAIVPAIMPVLFLAVALPLVDLPGCKTRGSLLCR
jgi:hypothetical protein